ncbi:MULTISPECIES: acyltransferase family protein [Streptomycetaceae]|nr:MULTISPECIES: acyltransferase family protein [Streptomycetaceae]MYS57463.1 acyltransferase family protein [Streptomyces sp. SID5468]CCB73051.1 Lipopolysaccharide modification acyltransferase [Streptantibioticus cattleyicolor NRRL 8057 = DSM 46488]
MNIDQRPAPAAPGTARVAGLDGLRAVAVAAVVAYHVHPSWLPGGFLGVDLFFVISGYLITSWLMAERVRTGRFQLRAFWVRRARRLLPALWAMLLVTACAATLTGGDCWAGLRGNLLAALTYSSNWWQISRHDTYFAGVGVKPVLQHLWSLSVEEQFYLLCPLLLFAVTTVLRRRRLQVALLLALAVLSFTAMALVFSPDTDTSRVYYGTDTHGGGLLLGAAAAFAVPLARAVAARSPGRITSADALGAAGFTVLAAAALLLDGTGAGVYRGGLAVATAAAVAVVVAAAVPGRIGRALSRPPLVWVGRRSYGIYLWHWPVIAVCAALDPGAPASPLWQPVALVAPVLLAAASYRLVEEPVIRLGVRGYARELTARHRARAAVRPRQALAVLVSAAAVVTVAGAGIVRAPSSTGLEAQISAGERLAAARPPDAARPVHRTDDTAADDPDDPTDPDQAPLDEEEAPARITGADVTAVGDSVMLAAARDLQRKLPGIVVEAKVGRQMDAAPELLRRLAGAGRLRKVVVVGLGTNGGFPKETAERLLAVTGPARRVLFVTVHAPRTWQPAVNATLADTVRAHPSTTRLVDWDTAISRHPEQLWADRIHPRPSAGTETYAALIASAVQRLGP